MNVEAGNMFCLACGAENVYETYDYVLCHRCGSWNLPPLVGSEAANKEFYDDVYDEIEHCQKSIIKKKLFRRYLKRDKQNRSKSYSDYDKFYDCLELFTENDLSVLEVGFGQGRTLSKLLREGKNAFGLDISDTAVNNFRGNYPEFADRVTVGTRFDSNVDIVYCSALFEHLEDPAQFIVDACASLVDGGLLIIDGLPVVNQIQADLTPAEDVNFWKPFHRAIYTVDGLSQLLQRSGFGLERYSTLDLFNNRMLSLHALHGFEEIVRLRSTTFKTRNMPGIMEYLGLCKASLKLHSLAVNGCFVFKKNVS